MHTIEPYFGWQHLYDSSEDALSPFYGQTYSEFEYSQTIYNYFIHPFWDAIGSPTLYVKIIMADYEASFLIAELIGEWNDAIHNDIMYLKRDIMDLYKDNGITKFILIGENVLNFHGSDSSYYDEWNEELTDLGGWICFINFLPHVVDEFRMEKLHNYINLHDELQNIEWRKLKPESLYQLANSFQFKYLK